MLKSAIFMDGTWFLRNTHNARLFKLDYTSLFQYLTTVLTEEKHIPITNIMVQSVLGTAVNVHPDDEDLIGIREKFVFHMGNYGSITKYETNFKKTKFSDKLVREKFVDVALASMLCYYSSVPALFDVAIMMIGDKDFIPAIETVRYRYGKQIAIVSYHDHCAVEYVKNSPKLRDYNIIWLTDEILDAYDLTGKTHTIPCESPLHEGDRNIETDFWPQQEQKFYCPACREKYTEMYKQQPKGDKDLAGEIVKFFPEKGYGFILSQGGEYFFHDNDVTPEDAEISVGVKVLFDIKKKPVSGKQGAAVSVRVL